ncbi:MAG TPA: hypothetical protein VHA05_03945 [Candidatus Saccharimonadales bacterium]|nr:hypothetical protein [Candidatus Saccharimonadales bacterium]
MFRKFSDLSIATFVVVGLVFAICTSSASAHKSHPHNAGNPFMKGWLHQPGAQGGASESSSSSEVIVLAYNSFKKGTEVNSPKCHWTDGENSGETATGEVFWFYDTHMYVCPNKESPTGWVKIKGGMTGARCFNAVKPNTPPKPTPKIVMVESFGKFKAVANAKARVKVKGSCGFAYAAARGHGMAYGMTKIQAKHNDNFVANFNAKAQATASAEARVVLVCAKPETPKAPEVPKPAPSVECQAGYSKNSMGYCVAQSNQAEQTCSAIGGSWNNITQKCKIKQINVNCGTVVDLEEVYVEGNLTINIENETCVNKEEKTEPPPPPPTCEETGTCPPPEKKYTEISCTGFEEITGGGSFLVDCEVHTNTGKPISLSAHSNDSNSRVSGINCYSNGGSQTCPSTGGTFEFRVSGINSGSTIKYSSITATASAGGVESKPFVSDQFPVDPENGGFEN